MAGKQELDAKIVELVNATNIQIAKANDVVLAASTIISEGTNAISRLLQKIATGIMDTQPEIDQIDGVKNSLSTASATLSDTKAALDSAIATFRVEGV